MQQRHDPFPSFAEYLHERRRRENRCGAPGARHNSVVAAGSPPQEPVSQHEERGLVANHERPVRQRLEWGLEPPLNVPARGPRGDPLGMQPRIQRIGPSAVSEVKIVPKCDKLSVVLVAAEGAGAVTGGKCCRLVEEEQLGESARLEEALALPPPELQAAGDPASAVEAPPDRPVRVVEAAAVAVDKAPRRVGDQIAERRDPVLKRHERDSIATRAAYFDARARGELEPVDKRKELPAEIELDASS